MAWHLIMRRNMWMVAIGILVAVEAEHAYANAYTGPTRVISGMLDVEFEAASRAPKGPPAEFVVRRDNAVIDSRIIIPRALLFAGKNSANTPDALPTGMRQQNAILAGLLLAIVIAGGGLIVTFARRRKPRAAAATLAAIFAQLMGSATP